jgi:hypothetical protein
LIVPELDAVAAALALAVLDALVLVGALALLELLELQAATSRPVAASAAVPIRRLFALMALSSYVSECYGLQVNFRTLNGY